jgi:hypothetical protein
MGEPTGITSNSAGIYSADLMYEQNCKCGTIEVLVAGETWSAGTGDNVWRIDVISNGEAAGRPNVTFAELAAKNISSQDCTKLKVSKYINGQSIMGDFTGVSISLTAGTTVILYKDCKQS